MFVITVAPLKRGITIDTLSYFSTATYPEGTILDIPVRNSTIKGLVTGSQEVGAAKAALRAATFSLKKLPTQEKPPRLGAAYIKTAQDLSAYYASPVGTILYNLLPPEIRNGDIPLPHTHHISHRETHTPEILQTPREDRYVAYRSLVRETFAHSGSILIVVPSSAEADTLKEELSNGIEERIVTLTSSMTKSALKKAYEELDDFRKTKLIIATASHAVIERHDITLVILEQSRSSYFREMQRPYLDYRDVLLTHAKHTGRRIILGDLLPRTEDEYKRRSEMYATYGEAPKRIDLPSKLTVVNMEKQKNEDGYYPLLSDALVQTIKDTRRRKGHTFLFAARRGLAPLVSCLDCGHIFRSPESGSPYSLVRTQTGDTEERWFVCGVSGERIRALDTCTECGSWRLRERGVGIQHIYDELHKAFPHVPITLFDHLSAKTYKKATFLRDTFYGTRGSIMLGTPMALPYLHKPVMTSAVVNMDALLATPTWKLDEENVALLLSLRERTTDTVLVQTRTKDSDILKYAKQGTVEQFYTDELELRKSFNYPPFTTFIHFTWQGSPSYAETCETQLKETFSAYNIMTYQSPTSPKGKPLYYGLIRINSKTWPDKKLEALIRGIDPSIRVMINPDRIV